ncbi:uncharacterized protein LY79DRAFT_48391 [Colletotrichum navitas]|uniref:Uncharacterized protein n=1 Tax=Colletotrichum navitas TaxID=681940 RepID=A0AAD8Q611_9PEZI|nr:uncharacterized protein LY79DRAFT_48391 [Colletotrichum navitas]KAK1596580.1 hypothetical protein LY79DRAFT_48391 [Colletotrichum navitas]
MMFSSAVSDLVDRRIQCRGGIRFWIHGTRPARKSRLIAVSRQEKDERKRNLDTHKKKLDMGNHFDMAKRPMGGPSIPSCFPAMSSLHGARKHMNHP